MPSWVIATTRCPQPWVGDTGQKHPDKPRPDCDSQDFSCPVTIAFFFFFGLSDRNELCCLLKSRNGSHCCFLALPLQWPDDLSPVENDRKPSYRPKMQKPQDKKEWHAQSHRAQDSEPGNPTSEPRCPSSFPGDLKPCTEHVTSPLEGELPPSMGLNEPLFQTISARRGSLSVARSPVSVGCCVKLTPLLTVPVSARSQFRPVWLAFS